MGDFDIAGFRERVKTARDYLISPLAPITFDGKPFPPIVLIEVDELEALLDAYEAEHARVEDMEFRWETANAANATMRSLLTQSPLADKAKLQAVLDLHTEVTHYVGAGTPGAKNVQACNVCRFTWPCPTVRSARGEPNA